VQALVKISELVAQNTRNKLVFSDHGIDELHFVDVGFELSLRLSHFSFDDDTALADILSQSSYNDKIGSYLAISNIGILFEPELKFNIRNIFDSYSKNNVLIIQSGAEIQEGIFYFLKKNDRSTVDLKGLTYLIV